MRPNHVIFGFAFHKHIYSFYSHASPLISRPKTCKRIGWTKFQLFSSSALANLTLKQLEDSKDRGVRPQRHLLMYLLHIALVTLVAILVQPLVLDAEIRQLPDLASLTSVSICRSGIYEGNATAHLVGRSDSNPGNYICTILRVIGARWWTEFGVRRTCMQASQSTCCTD